MLTCRCRELNLRLSERRLPLQGDLNCHGYGSSVMVTAAFGLAAAGDVLQQVLVRTPGKASVAEPL